MMGQESAPPRDATGLLQLAGAYRLSQAIAAAASIGVGDALGGAARDSGSVAREIGAHPATLHRLLRALAGGGVLREDESGRFSLTALGQCLRSDDPDGTRAMILGWTCLADGYDAFGRLAESVLTGGRGSSWRSGSRSTTISLPTPTDPGCTAPRWTAPSRRSRELSTPTTSPRPGPWLTSAGAAARSSRVCSADTH